MSQLSKLKFQDETILFQPATWKQRSAKHLGARDDCLQITAVHIWSSDLAKLLMLSITKTKLKDCFGCMIRNIKVRKH